jgi:hypothetical protein
MRVVTFNARRRDGNVGIDRFKDLFRAGRHSTYAGIRSIGTGLHFLQTPPLELGACRIGLIDRPLTDQAVADIRTG